MALSLTFSFLLLSSCSQSSLSPYVMPFGQNLWAAKVAAPMAPSMTSDVLAMFSAFSELVLPDVSRMWDSGPRRVCRDDDVTSVRRERVDRVGERDGDREYERERDEYDVVLYTPSEYLLRLREFVERPLEVTLPLEGERDGDGVREGERYRGMLDLSLRNENGKRN